MSEQSKVPNSGTGGTQEGAGRPAEEPRRRGMLPVWFFVGIIFLIYGILIVATGLYELSHPAHTVLANLHPAIWWGAVIACVGGIFFYTSGPWRSRR
jgi:hypothetical protein